MMNVKMEKYIWKSQKVIFIFDKRYSIACQQTTMHESASFHIELSYFRLIVIEFHRILFDNSIYLGIHREMIWIRRIALIIQILFFTIYVRNTLSKKKKRISSYERFADSFLMLDGPEIKHKKENIKWCNVQKLL